MPKPTSIASDQVASDQNERLDLVNDEDVVVGTISRGHARRTKAKWVRVINAFIINSQGELWIPRRTAHKETFPLCLDMSVGGHVVSGESYEVSFVREAAEELNLDVTKESYREIGYLNPVEHGLSSFMKVFELKMDEAPPYNRDEFISAEWLGPTVLLERLQRGEAAKGDLEQLVRLFYT